MTPVNVIGIDPGLVDTGVVSMTFCEDWHTVDIRSLVLPKHEFDRDPDQLHAWIKRYTEQRQEIFVEKFVPRPGMNTSPAMLELEQKIKQVLPQAAMLRNMGVKQVITQPVMEALQVWKFAQATHHQDLRAAARIGLFGMAKLDSLNLILARVLIAQADGIPWQFSH